MAKLCKVTVSFDILLNVDPIEMFPELARDNEKLKEIEKIIYEKHPTLMDCSNVYIVSCIKHMLAEPEELCEKETEYGKAMMPDKGR